MSTAVPRDEAAEKIIPGILMERPELVDKFHGLGVREKHFPDPRLMRLVCEAAFSGRRADALSLQPKLDVELFAQASESQIAASGLWMNLEEYCERLKDAWRRREIVYLAQSVAKNGIGGELSEVCDRWESIVKDVPDASSLPGVVDASAFIEADMEQPADLIEGLLHQGAKLVLGGGSKSFKTWSLLDMGISVAAGAEWWGFQTQQGRVLYVNFEIQPVFFAQRIREISTAKGLKLKAGQLDVLNLRGYAADAEVILPQIIRRMSAGKYALAIIDPLYKLLGSRDENASRDMADLMNAIERVTVQTGAAVAFGSHFAKGNASGKESMDRISGSGVFSRDPDSILTMTRHEQDDAFTVEMTLRNHPPAEAFVVRRQHPLMLRDGALDPGKLKQVGGRKKGVSEDEVLALLNGGALTYAEWCEKAVNDLLISADTFKRRLQILTKERRIRKSPMEGNRYVKS